MLCIFNFIQHDVNLNFHTLWQITNALINFFYILSNNDKNIMSDRSLDVYSYSKI